MAKVAKRAAAVSYEDKRAKELEQINNTTNRSATTIFLNSTLNNTKKGTTLDDNIANTRNTPPIQTTQLHIIKYAYTSLTFIAKIRGYWLSCHITIKSLWVEGLGRV